MSRFKNLEEDIALLQHFAPSDIPRPFGKGWKRLAYSNPAKLVHLSSTTAMSMADFELNPDMVLGPSGKLELLYNRAMERSKAQQSKCG